MIAGLSEREAEAAEVLGRYTTALDTKDWELLVECFTPECAFTASEMVLDGRDAIVEFMRPAHQHLDGSLHRLTNIRVQMGDDEMTATTASYLDAFIVHRAHRDGPTCQVIGVYHDRLSRHDGTWRIADRRFELLWRDGNPTILGPTVA